MTTGKADLQFATGAANTSWIDRVLYATYACYSKLCCGIASCRFGQVPRQSRPCQVGMPNKILAHAERPESLASPSSCSPSRRIRGRCVSSLAPQRRSFDAAVPLYGEPLTLREAGLRLVVAVAPNSSSWKYTVCTVPIAIIIGNGRVRSQNSSFTPFHEKTLTTLVFCHSFVSKINRCLRYPKQYLGFFPSKLSVLLVCISHYEPW